MEEKKKEVKFIKIGNTSFRPDFTSMTTYKKFKNDYEKIMRGVDMDKAWAELGGKLPKNSD